MSAGIYETVKQAYPEWQQACKGMSADTQQQCAQAPSSQVVNSAGLQATYQWADQLPRVSHFEPEPGGDMLEPPVGQQLLMDEAMVALPVSHPQSH